MLITKDYFIAELNIPTNNVNVEPALNAFIAKYEKRFLVGLLGGLDYYTGFNTDVAATVPAAIALKDLLVDADTKVSIIANYTYYWWMRNEHTQNVGLGVVKTDAENAVPVSPNGKLIKAMDEARVMYLDIIDHLKLNYPIDKWSESGSLKFFRREINNINSFNL